MTHNNYWRTLAVPLSMFSLCMYAGNNHECNFEDISKGEKKIIRILYELYRVNPRYRFVMCVDRRENMAQLQESPKGIMSYIGREANGAYLLIISPMYKKMLEQSSRSYNKSNSRRVKLPALLVFEVLQQTERCKYWGKYKEELSSTDSACRAIGRMKTRDVKRLRTYFNTLDTYDIGSFAQLCEEELNRRKNLLSSHCAIGPQKKDYERLKKYLKNDTISCIKTSNSLNYNPGNISEKAKDMLQKIYAFYNVQNENCLGARLDERPDMMPKDGKKGCRIYLARKNGAYYMMLSPFIEHTLELTSLEYSKEENRLYLYQGKGGLAIDILAIVEKYKSLREYGKRLSFRESIERVLHHLTLQDIQEEQGCFKTIGGDYAIVEKLLAVEIMQKQSLLSCPSSRDARDNLLLVGANKI